TANSKQVLSAVRYHVSRYGKILTQEDLFDTSEWEAIAEDRLDLNHKLMTTQGPIGFVLVPSEATETSYPRRKTLEQIESETAELRVMTSVTTQDSWNASFPAAASLALRAGPIAIVMAVLAFIVSPWFAIPAYLMGAEAIADIRRNMGRDLSFRQALSQEG